MVGSVTVSRRVSAPDGKQPPSARELLALGTLLFAPVLLGFALSLFGGTFGWVVGISLGCVAGLALRWRHDGPGGHTLLLRQASFSRRAIWVVTSVLAVGAVMNAASSSSWERFGWAPLLLVLAILSFRLARSPGPEQHRVGHGLGSMGTA